MLTDKQEKFVQELVKGKSQREAYKASYNAERMKDATIDKKASYLMKQGKVRGRYEELMQGAREKGADDAESIRKLIIDTEKAIINANLGDIYHIEQDKAGNAIARVNPDQLQHFDMRAVQEVRFDARGRVILKLFDKQAAAKMLQEMYGLQAEEKHEEINVIFKASEGYDV